jgi:hypothetical protein
VQVRDCTLVSWCDLSSCQSIGGGRGGGGKGQTTSLADALDRKAEESIRLLSSFPFEEWGVDQKEPDLAVTSDTCYLHVCNCVTEGDTAVEVDVEFILDVLRP